MRRYRTLALAIVLALSLAAAVPSARAQIPGAPGGVPAGDPNALPGNPNALPGDPNAPPGDPNAPPGGPGGAMMGPMRGAGPQSTVQILLAPAVQKELKLTDAQKNKVYGLSRTAGQKFRDFAQAMMLSRGNGDPQANMAAGHKLRQEIDGEVAKILDAKQNERLNQIALQAEGPLAVARPEVASKLNLNPAQKQAIQEVMLDLQQSQMQMFMQIRQNAMLNGQPDPAQFAQMRQMTSNLRQEAVQQIGQVLDKKQKGNFNKMLGEPFDIKKLENTPMPGAADPAAPGGEDEAKASGANTPPEKEAPKDTPRPTRKKGRAKTGSGQ
jgi:hypothetical protein